MLINRRVDVYQKDEHGRTAVEVCCVDLREEVMRMVKVKGKGCGEMNY